MRVLTVLALLAIPALAGCLSVFDKAPPREVVPADVGYDPDAVKISGSVKSSFTVTSFDGVELAVVAYEPTSLDALPDGTAPRWPVVVFLHGWGGMKESYEGADAAPAPIQAPSGAPVAPPVNRLQEFALAGFVAVAYDARGFGQSDGQATVAGPAEMADIGAILDEVAARFNTNGYVGLVGESYGAGQSLLAWSQDARITTAVSIYGWADLYEGLVTGNVPKLEWAQILYGGGIAGSRGRLHPMIHEWYASALTRTGMEDVHAAMDARSVGAALQVDKPLFACQGLQESLFPQVDMLWDRPGFTRAYVYTGGHGSEDAGCWQRTLEWFRFFLAGYDTQVDSWPAIEAVRAPDGALTPYPSFPTPATKSFFLRHGEMAAAASDATFTIEQRLLANPFTEPSGAWDQTGSPYNPVPSQFRQDPTAVFFTGPPSDGADVVFGAPEVRLALAEDASPPFQITATLYLENAQGSSIVLSRGAAAPLSEDDVADGNLTVRLHFTHAVLSPGDRLVLKLGANDPSWWYPLLANYSATFTGHSEFVVPMFE